MIEEHEKLLSEAFLSFTKLERLFRQKIGEVLSKRNGTGWSTQLPESISDRLEKKLQEKSDLVVGPDRDDNLLNVADFSELVSIVEFYWEYIFVEFFIHKDITMGLFETVRNYRNALMHSVLQPNDCPTFIGFCNDLIVKIEAVPLKENFKTTTITTPKTNIPIAQSSLSDDQKKFRLKISSILIQMTGLFEGELNALLDFVRMNLGLCTPILLEEIQQKFINLPGTNDAIDNLLSKMPPPKPKQPEANSFNIKDWIKWAATSYLPYRYWMMMNDQVDKELEYMSIAFEDWLYKSYPGLIAKNPDKFVFRSSIQINKLLNDNKKVLWVMIDNLPYYYLSRFTKQLNTFGFTINETVRQISMLPSYTGISRKSALAGKLPNQMPEAIDEKTMALDAWENLTKKRIVWFDDSPELENANQYDADLYIYVYGRLDKLWHMPSSKDFHREDEIYAALDIFISKVKKSFEGLAQRDPTVLVISTDHGAIFLPPNCEQLTIPTSAIKDEEFEEHKRFVRISGKESLNKNEWFYLDKDEYYLHQNYAIARGWRSIGIRSRSFTHGGLSPEETIIPLLVCELGKSEFERLQPTYEQVSPAMYPGRAGELIIRVSNPYKNLIENLEISLSDFGLTFPPIDVEPNLQADTTPLKFTLPSKTKIEKERYFLNINSHFKIGEQQRSQTTKLVITVKSIFKTNLDDDLGAIFND